MYTTVASSFHSTVEVLEYECDKYRDPIGDSLYMYLAGPDSGWRRHYEALHNRRPVRLSLLARYGMVNCFFSDLNI